MFEVEFKERNSSAVSQEEKQERKEECCWKYLNYKHLKYAAAAWETIIGYL